MVQKKMIVETRRNYGWINQTKTSGKIVNSMLWAIKNHDVEEDEQRNKKKCCPQSGTLWFGKLK